MKKEFVMRGQTASGQQEVLNFSGHKKGYAYRLVEFQLYPSTALGNSNAELVGSITAGKTAVAPEQPNFDNEGLIATTMVLTFDGNPRFTGAGLSVINDLFLITQDLILMVLDVDVGSPINWQCRFVSEKMDSSQEAVTNYNQFTISDG